MKILLVSLLRLGDTIQHAPLITGLKRKFPGARIDILGFTTSAGLMPLMPGVAKWWLLDHTELQSGLGEPEIPLLTSFDVLRETLEAINSEEYDLAINVTQTKFSGYVMGYLEAKDKNGLTLTAEGQALFHSPWMRYLNDSAEWPGREVFHHIDVFARALELEMGLEYWPLERTPAGEFELASLRLPPGEWIVLQTQTSDSKKTWPTERWIEFIQRVAQLRPFSTFILLGSPTERPQLEHIAKATGARMAILSLEGALSLLERAHLLVTGDTSIKHMANATTIPVVELSLGSSDFFRTGVFKSGSLILQPKVECAPCAHSSPCTQAFQKCAYRLDPGVVAGLVDAFLRRDRTALAELASRHVEWLSTLETTRTSDGDWLARDVSGIEWRLSVHNWLERTTRKAMVHGEWRQTVPSIGGELFAISDGLKESAIDAKPILGHLEFLENQLSSQPNLRFNVRPLSTGTLVDLTPLRHAQEASERSAHERDLKLKLIRSLKAQLSESQ